MIGLELMIVLLGDLAWEFSMAPQPRMIAPI
jgi:hypothetical protein